MADTVLSTDWYSNAHLDQIVGPIWTSTTVGYVVYHDTGFRIRYRKTTDGGQTWGAAVTLMTGTSAWASLGVWYDKWTPGNSGTKIRVIGAWGSVTYYCDLDTSSDTVSGTVTVASGQSATSGSVAASIVVARNGSLKAVVMRASTTQTAYKSVNDGASWSTITLPGTSSDTLGTALRLHPGNAADTADVWLIQRLDTYGGVGAVVQKMYDDSANTWSQYLIGYTDTTLSLLLPQLFTSATRLSDGHVFVIFANNTWNGADIDLLVFEVTGNSAVTARTNLTTNITNILSVAVLIDEASNVLYASYIRGASQSPNSVFYKTSADNGVTWGTEQVYSSASYDQPRRVWSGQNVGNSGGRFYLIWILANTVRYNYANSIAIAPLVSVPTVTTQAATDITATTATGNGNITDTGGENCTERGVEWGTVSGVYPNSATDAGSFDTGAFTKGITGLSNGVTYYYRAKAYNSAGWGYGSEVSFVSSITYPEEEVPAAGVEPTGQIRVANLTHRYQRLNNKVVFELEAKFSDIVSELQASYRTTPETAFAFLTEQEFLYDIRKLLELQDEREQLERSIAIRQMYEIMYTPTSGGMYSPLTQTTSLRAAGDTFLSDWLKANESDFGG